MTLAWPGGVTLAGGQGDAGVKSLTWRYQDDLQTAHPHPLPPVILQV